MRIAIISSDALPVFPERYGGLEVVAGLESRELAKMGHEVTLFALRESDPFPEGKLIEFDSVEECFNYEDILLKQDIIHGHDWGRFVWKFRAKHPDLEKPKLIQTWHGEHIGLEPCPEGVIVNGISELNAFVLSAELNQYCPCVYNGVDLNHYPLCEGPRENYLLYMNRIAPEKGLHYCLELARRYDFTLQACGTEHMVPDPEYVAAMLKQMDGGQFVYAGDLGMEMKVELLQHAKALLWVCPWLEPFGLGPVEANACGTPVIALAWGGVVETVGRGGVLIKNFDEFPMALKGIEKITPQICHKNAERFSAERMAKGYLELFK